jgi:uncharacterized protein YbdZ (MbtH family)
MPLPDVVADGAVGRVAGAEGPCEAGLAVTSVPVIRKGAERGSGLSNPFDDNDGTFFALINDEGQYSLWPAFADVPDGWQVVCGADSRDVCLNYIEKEWTDMRPKSLIAAMESAAEGNPGALSQYCGERI